MKYFYQANGNLISNKLFENFENNIEKVSLKKHLLQMTSDTNKLKDLNSRLDELESNFMLKINNFKNYFPFTLEDSKMVSFKDSNWTRDTSTNEYIYYIEYNYQSDNEPMIFSQIHDKKKSNLEYKFNTEIIQKNKKIRFNLELINFNFDSYKNKYSTREKFLKDTFVLNTILIG
tara:strand:+ start:3547 stop:4071 length:525 start_codon:yes stop_codon:yes gene_type:complete